MTTAKERDAAIAALALKVSDHETRITALGLAVEAHDERIDDVEAAVAADTEAMSGLATRVGSLEVRVAKLEAPVEPPPPVDPPPVEPPPIVGKSVTVTSIPSLLAAVADDANDEVVVRDGPYTVGAAGFGYTNDADFASGRLWIGSSHRRTRPVLVRPQTPYGVSFNSPGGHISFMNGACNQTWDGFVLAGGTISSTGSITVGGWPELPGAHHVTLRRIRFDKSIRSNSGGNPPTDHAIYIGGSAGGSHDFLLEDIDIDCSGGLDCALHFYPKGQSAWNWTTRRVKIANAVQAVMLWDSSLRDILLDDVTITGSKTHAVSYNHPGSRITLRKVTSTGTGGTPLDTPEGTSGLTVEACSFA